ncbi:LON peptidase substrate-binding domain-containing protein [Robertkochia sediminum]|uniref:LON peptidase substrate-binding domain-containing protein n=1 Tax=Robertkochia sediminum TaxID=2785326 RepID=UPI0019333E6A|nr:LON peptidase substrate-binding domain-containing protein [Robertkochia sediminum]MBL7472672.1 LON peptidase substrate-binding domain-containing protein [Robertkochia sediminum]
MSALIPLFPLQIVVFPGEKLPLHVFEERYRELVKDCRDGKQSFGIPTVIDGSLGYGSELYIEEVSREYPSGRYDIVCRAGRAFKLLEFVNPVPGKRYAGGVLEYLENVPDGLDTQRERVIVLLQTLYEEIGVDNTIPGIADFDTFTYAHKVGFNLKEEYLLLQMTSEADRLDHMERHLQRIIPVIRQVNATKKMIQMNGHFRNYDPLDFKDFKLS